MRSEKVKYQICSIWRKFGEISKGIFNFCNNDKCKKSLSGQLFNLINGKKLMDSDFVHCFEDRTIMKMPPEF